MIGKMLLPLAALAFAAWCVALGGLAALQHSLHEDDISSNDFLGRGMGFGGNFTSSSVLRFYWFVIGWEFVLVVALLAAAASGFIHRSRNAFIGLFAVALMLYIMWSDASLSLRSRPPFNLGGKLEARARCMAAGAIMTAAFNALIIIALGIVDLIHVPAHHRNIDEKPTVTSV